MDRPWLRSYPPGVAADIDPSRYSSLVAMFEQSFAAYGARPVKRALRQLVEDQLAVALIAGEFKGARGLRVDLAEPGAQAPLAFKRLDAPTP